MLTLFVSYRSNSLSPLILGLRFRWAPRKNLPYQKPVRTEATAAPLRYLERRAYDARAETILWLWDPNNDRQQNLLKRSSKVTHWLENVFHHITMVVARATLSQTRCYEFSAFSFITITHLIFRDYVKYRCYQEHTRNWRFVPIFGSSRIKVRPQRTK